MKNGKFVISLDFELHWGVAELWDVNDRKDYFNNARKGIPLMLSLFEKYEIHATWATVGFLFAKDKKQLLDFSPSLKPTYKDMRLSYYSFLDENRIGNNEIDDPFHYAHSLIEEIIKTPGQELATHTFAHYYCNEPGQNKLQFESDLIAALALSKENFNIEMKSLVFPRNQFNSEYTDIAKKHGIKVVRSNPDVWFWKTTSNKMALARAFDTLMPISSSVTFNEKKAKKNEVLLLPASRFLRAYSNKEKLIQSIKLRRIKNEMTFAAKNNKVYHLWWHPHNFGYFLNENLEFLETILQHFKSLQKEYGFESNSMIEMIE